MTTHFKAYDQNGNIRLDSESSVLIVDSHFTLTGAVQTDASYQTRSAYSPQSFLNTLEGDIYLNPNSNDAGERSRFKAFLPCLRDNHQITLPNVFGSSSYYSSSSVGMSVLTTDPNLRGIIVAPSAVVGKKGFMNIYNESGELMFSALGLLESVRFVGNVFVKTDGVRSGQHVTSYTVPQGVDMDKLYLMYSGYGDIGYPRGVTSMPGGGITGAWNDDIIVVGLAIGRKGRTLYFNPVGDIFVQLTRQWFTLTMGTLPPDGTGGMSAVLGTQGGITVTLVTTG